MLACGHDDATGKFGVCAHVRAGEGYRERFLGRGIECDLVCKACVEAVVDVICGDCRAVATTQDNEGWVGAPGIVEEPSSLRFEHLPPITPRVAALLDLAALPGGDLDRWIGVTTDRDLVELDLDRDEVRRIATLPAHLFELVDHEGTSPATPRDPPAVTLHVSRDGSLAAVVQEDYGLRCLVVDLATGEHLLPLTRDAYCAEHCRHSFAFVEHAGRTLVVHASDWNRLDVHDPRTRELITARGRTSYKSDEERPEHYLDYFHCGLAVSPSSTWISDNGWVWQPWGAIAAWRVDHWLSGNVWESEDGPSRKALAWRDPWDMPVCWIDDTQLAIWGYGEDQLLPAVRILNAEDGAQVRWFAGPSGHTLVFDRVLVSFDVTASVWSVDRGTRLLADPAPSPTLYHPTAKSFARFDGSTIHRSRLLGLDARFRTGAIADLADRIAREKAFDDLPVLGDALEAAGCADHEMLEHCQHPGEHADRCWVLERLELLRARS